MKKKALSALLLCMIIIVPLVRGQKPAQTQPQEQTDEVLRINTELVQTDVTVFDKQGRFVEGLQREQFELRVDGKPMPISFFERVAAGSTREAALLAARTGEPAPKTASTVAASQDRGRTVIFFIDDLHLSPAGVERTRQTILQFIETQMSFNDQVVVATATNQIGFLEQFTDNKSVLRAAIARLKYRPYVVQDAENISMTEYTAVRINQGDKDSLDYYTNELLKASNARTPGGAVGPPAGGPAASSAGADERNRTNGLSRNNAEAQVRRRADLIVKQSANVTQGTLYGLESLMRSSAQLPGRKLVFLISDGFYLIDRVSGASDTVRRITDAATRAGVVIYSLDARGMMSMTDASSNRADPTGRLGRSNIGETTASQDALNALAEDTGGRALFNSSAFNSAINDALKETSNYYVLAWRPVTDEQKSAKFKRIEVSVAGRSDLSVRLPRGYMEADANAATARTATKNSNASSTTAKPEAASPTETALRNALLAPTPKRQIPTIVSASFLDTPNNGLVLTASTQLATAPLNYGADGKQPAAVDVAGVVLNDLGKPAASFKTRLNVNPLASTGTGSDSVIYNYRATLKPGIYQVRVAARDDKSGLVGSAMHWIEIPDLSSKKLTLSSLLVGGQLVGGATEKKEGVPQVQFSVDRRFAHASHLGFWVFVYNATRGTGGNAAPDLTAQVQVFRDGRALVTTPQRKLQTAGMTDLARIPYGGEFPLNSLAPGRYLLQVTITDRLSNTSATQRVSFDVE
jgi:VWFA-related protein